MAVIPFTNPKTVDFRLGELAWRVVALKTAAVRSEKRYGGRLVFRDKSTRRWIAALGPLGFSERTTGTWVAIQRLKPTDVARLRRRWAEWCDYYRACPLEPSRGRGVIERVWSRYPEMPGGRIDSNRRRH